METTYTYYKSELYDNLEAHNYSILRDLFINIVSIGLKPAASVASSVLSALIGTLPTTSTQYVMKSYTNSRITTKRGQVYSTMGITNPPVWKDYVFTSSEDVYAEVYTSMWNGGVFTSNTKTANTKFSYNWVWNDTVYMRQRTMQLYAEALAQASYLYGVGFVVNFEMYHDPTYVFIFNNEFD